MKTSTSYPPPNEMEKLLQQASLCLDCDAPQCHEFTPEGVSVCGNLPYWEGKPVTRQMLLAWQEFLRSSRAD